MQHNHITFLRSQNAILAVLILALIAQLPHAADVFRLIVHGTGIGATVHSYSFAIALELAVLLFVVQNRHTESYGFAAVSIAMNLSYYHLHGVHLFDLSALPALLVSVALPVAIARYSHAVADVHDVAPEVEPPKPAYQPSSFALAAIGADHVARQMVAQDEAAAQAGELVVHDDRLHNLTERIADLQSEGLDAKWIATKECADIAGAQLAPLLNVNASTISRWRKAAQEIA